MHRVAGSSARLLTGHFPIAAPRQGGLRTNIGISGASGRTKKAGWTNIVPTWTGFHAVRQCSGGPMRAAKGY
jgi:hypothetical protein